MKQPTPELDLQSKVNYCSNFINELKIELSLVSNKKIIAKSNIFTQRYDHFTEECQDNASIWKIDQIIQVDLSKLISNI